MSCWMPFINIPMSSTSQWGFQYAATVFAEIAGLARDGSCPKLVKSCKGSNRMPPIAEQGRSHCRPSCKKLPAPNTPHLVGRV